MPDTNDNNHVDGYHSHVAFPSTAFESLERIIIEKNNYSFLRLRNMYIDTMVDDRSEPIYLTIHFSDISNNSEHISGLTNHQFENCVELSALVAQVSYDNGTDTTSWIIGSGSTHYTKGFAKIIFNMTLEGYDDCLLIK